MATVKGEAIREVLGRVFQTQLDNPKLALCVKRRFPHLCNRAPEKKIAMLFGTNS